LLIGSAKLPPLIRNDLATWDGPATGPGPVPPPLARHPPWEYQTGRFVALGHDFRIRCTDGEMGRYLDHVLGSLSAAGAARHDYAIVEQAGGGYALYLDGIGVNTMRERVRAVRHLLWHVNSEVLRVTRGLVLVHAAAATYGGSALLLPGGMNVGKTTLVTRLVLDGFDLLTDELAALEVQGDLVHPYPRPMNLGEGSWPLLPAARPPAWSPTSPFTERQWHVNPNDLRHGAVAVPTPPRFVVAPRREPGGGSRLEPLSRAAALRLLFEQTMNADVLGVDVFHTLVRVVRGADCAQLAVDTVEDGAELVRQAMERGT
jgi:hypothetical protein